MRMIILKSLGALNLLINSLKNFRISKTLWICLSVLAVLMSILVIWQLILLTKQRIWNQNELNAKDNKYLKVLKPEIKRYSSSKNVGFASNFALFNKVKASFQGNEILANALKFWNSIAHKKIEEKWWKGRKDKRLRKRLGKSINWIWSWF